jgi:outer membrane protein insertion porin family
MYKCYKSTLTFLILTGLILPIFFASCGVTKKVKYDKNKVYLKKNGIAINIVNAIPNKEKKELKNIFKAQLDKRLSDSLIKTKIFWAIGITLNKRAEYNSSAINRSAFNIQQSLIENGYFLGTVKVDTLTKKRRASINFTIDLKKPYTVNSFTWELNNPNLNKYSVIKSSNDSIIQINKRFTKSNALAEINRIVEKMRNDGYYKISNVDFVCEIDTANKFLRNTSIDIDEIIAAAKEAKKFYTNPYLDCYIKKQQTKDSSIIFKQYRINKIYIIPELGLSNASYQEDVVKNIYFLRQKTKKFKDKIFLNNMYLFKDSLFSTNNLNKTLFALNRTELFQNIRPEVTNIDTTNYTIDYIFKMTPKLKQSVDFGLDASRNASSQSNGFGVGNNGLWGFGLSGSYLNRNVGKEGIKSSSALSGLVEISGFTKKLANYNLFVKQQFIVPKIFAMPKKNIEKHDYTKSLLDVNLGLTSQENFLKYLSLEAGIGFEKKRTKSPFAFRIKALHIEFYKRIFEDTTFTNFINNNPQLEFIYREGFVAGTQFGFTYTVPKKNKLSTTVINFNLEESFSWGALLNSKTKYLKGDASIIHNITTNYEKNNSLVFKLAYSRGYDFNAANNAMPIFKKYLSGGPSSMRAWRFRQLGPGAFNSDTIPFTQVGGDIQMELNIEKRWALPFTWFGFKYSTCAFLDVGNTFNNKNSTTFLNSNLTKNTFFKRIAMAVGTGLRIDFNYVLVRLDVAYRLKDPYRKTGSGFPNSLRGINAIEFKEEFVTSSGLKPNYSKNYAFQFGINYPF